MRKIHRSLLVSLALVAGCGSSKLFSAKPTIIPLGTTPGVVVTSAAQRQTYLRPIGEKVPQFRICSEPMPDAVLDQQLKQMFGASHKGSVGLKLRNVNLSISGDNALQWSRELALEHQELAGRTWTVLLAREFLYRMCELTLNLEPGSPAFEAAVGHYDKISTAITAIAAAEQAKAEGRKIEAEVERLKLEERVKDRASQMAERIALILGRVTTGAGAACKVDGGRLDGLLKDEKFAGLRDRLKGVGCEELRGRLESLDVGTLGALATAP